MERFGIASATPLKQWCRLYREGGARGAQAQSLRAGRGGRARRPTPPTREQELEREVQEARGAGGVPKKIDCPEGAERAPEPGEGPSGRRAFRAWTRGLRPPGGRRPLQVELLLRAGSSQERRPGQSCGARVARDLRRAPERASVTGRWPWSLRAVDGARIADKTVLEDDARDGATLRHPPRDRRTTGTAPTRGTRRRELRERRSARDFEADRPLAEDGHRRHRVQAAPSARPTSRPCTTSAARRSSRGRSRSAPASPSRRRCSPCSWRRSRRARAPSCTPTWAGSASTRPTSRSSAENGFVQSMSRRGNCIDNGATEQVFGHLKDEFFRGTRLERLRELQARPRGLHPPLEPCEAPGQAEGPDPSRVPGPGPSGGRLAAMIYRVQVLGRGSSRRTTTPAQKRRGPALGAGPLPWRKRPQSASGVLVSHGLDPAVQSALGGLTSGFGMGPGVPPLPWPLAVWGRSASGGGPTVPWGPHSARKRRVPGTAHGKGMRRSSAD